MTPEPLDAEDAKIVTLARSTRARSATAAAAAAGAAVRDTDGRTYAAATVDLPSLRLSALQLAVAMAASSGVTAVEAAAVVTTESTVDSAGLAAVRDLGPAAPVILAAPDGSIREILRG